MKMIKISVILPFCFLAGLSVWGCTPQKASGAGAKDEKPAAVLPEAWSELRQGMSQKQVYDLLGLPVRVEGKETLKVYYRFGTLTFEGADGYGYDKKGVLRSWKTL